MEQEERAHGKEVERERMDGTLGVSGVQRVEDIKERGKVEEEKGCTGLMEIQDQDRIGQDQV